jgi:holo-[acyl-carrier protein] synthase
MIFGVGTDIVQVTRMRKNLDQYGEKFAQRILTESELQEFRRQIHQAHFLAKRFAAKEAAAKAMGIGFSNGLSFHHIGVAHDAAGKPTLEFSGYALEFMKQKGIHSAHISLADEQDYAVAFVTLSTKS